MTNPNSPSTLFDQAATATMITRYWDAIQLYTDILAQTEPNSTDENIRQMRLNALEKRSYLLRLLGEQEAALAGYEQYYLEAGSSEKAVKALVEIARQRSRLGQYQLGLDTLKEALTLAEALNYTAGRADVLGVTGFILSNLSRLEDSLGYHLKALPLYEQLRDQKGQMVTHNRMGVVYARMGFPDKAIISFRSCLNFARQIEDQEYIVYALGNLGETYQQLFNMEQATIYHREGLAVAMSTRLGSLEVDNSRNLGIDLIQSGWVDDGIAYLHHAMKLARETGQNELYFQTLDSLALAYIEHGELEKGFGFAQELKKIVEERKLKGEHARVLHTLGIYYQKKGEVVPAQQCWQQALFLAHETNQRVLVWQIHAGLAQVAPNPDLAAVHNRIAAEVIQQIAYPIEDVALRNNYLNAPPIKAVLDQVKA